MNLRNRWAISLVASIVVLVSLWWGIPSYRKDKADAMVRELCAKDGKMMAYEVVALPAARFNTHGNVIFRGRGVGVPLQRNMRPEDDFFYTWETTLILREVSFGPAVLRDHQKLFRRVDQKLLGEVVGYSRVGGDAIGPWHPSSFRCPPNVDITVLEKKIFIKQQ
jgi:hypothetical protein